MLNSNSKDGTEVPQNAEADVPTSSQTIAKPNVMRRFLFQYRSTGKDLMVTLEGNSLNDTMVKFATLYHSIDEVYEIAEVGQNGA